VISGEVWHARAVEAVNAGRFGTARRLLGRARRAAPTPATLGAVEATLAYLEAETGNLPEAMRLCDEALSRTGLDEQIRGSIHSQRATLMMLEGRSVEAMAELDVAIAMLHGSPKFLGRAYGNRGNLRLQRNDVAAAVRDFTAASRLLHEAGLPVEAAMDEHNLGYAHLLTGDLVGALREMDRARTILAPLSPVAQATCDQDRAEVLMAAGLAASGRAALDAAARAYGSRRVRRLQAEAELALARNLLHADPAAARDVARQAARRFARAGADQMADRAAAVVFVASLAGPGSLAARLRTGEELIAALDAQQMHWVAGRVRLALATRCAEAGVPDKAAALVTSARVGRAAPLDVRLLARSARAEIALTRGRRGRALRHLRAGLSDLHAWQSSFGSLDLQTGVAGHGTRLGVRGLALAADSRDPEVLFEWSERARMLASRVQPVRAPEDPDLVADLTELREMAAGEAGDRTSPEREAELRQRVRERAWRHQGSGEVADPVTLDELATALADDTALVAYVVTATAVVALVVTSTETTWVDLGHRDELDALLGGLLPDLDVAAADLPDAMGAFVRAELASRLDTLAGLVVAPVLDAVGDRRVVLTPSGVLSGVPWTLLPGYVGRPVTVAQSATAWLSRSATPLRTSTAGFVAGPRVARAEDEVIAAATTWPGARVLLGAEATAEAVSALADSVDVLHVAAHGRHSAENAMFAGVQLVDGPWFGYDIDRLQRVPDIVLLSACEVGRSTVRWGEELIGMTTAWLHAGARCVIASPAAINDQAAYGVLVAVHQRLVAGLDPAAALAESVPAASADRAPVPLVCFG
jgi:tetratricopeptide (TPR) repeat protein